MTGVLDRARAHFARLSDQRMEVPEWGDESGPLVVTFSPLTLRQRERLAASAKGSDAAATVLVVIRHAKDAEGAPLFEENAATRKALENDADPGVVARIAARILQASEEEELGES